MNVPSDAQATNAATRLSVLVGVPDAGERARVCALLRAEGHAVIEATDAREMNARLDQLAGNGPDAIVCAGIMAEHDDPALAVRLSSPQVARAVILLPSGGFLSTARRAHQLRASAVLPDIPALHKLREMLSQPDEP